MDLAARDYRGFVGPSLPVRSRRRDVWLVTEPFTEEASPPRKSRCMRRLPPLVLRRHGRKMKRN